MKGVKIIMLIPNCTPNMECVAAKFGSFIENIFCDVFEKIKE
jgi:hypothetical protein